MPLRSFCSNPRADVLAELYPMKLALISAAITLCCLAVSSNVLALEVDQYPKALIETNSSNTLGRPEGNQIAVSIGGGSPSGLDAFGQVVGVDPRFTTLVTATQGDTSTSVELRHLLSSYPAGVFFPREHWVYIDYDSALTGSWDVSVTDLADPSGTTEVVSTKPITVSPLPLPTDVQVDLTTGALSPTVTWTNPVDYDGTNFRIIDSRTNMRVAQAILPGDTDELSIPEGILAPTGQYTFRIMGIESEVDVDSNRTTPLARANTYFDYIANSTDREAGDVRVLAPSVDTGVTIGAGANSFPDTNIVIGGSSPGAVTIDSTSTLTSSFINVGGGTYFGNGFGGIGNLLIDGGSVELYGTDGFANPNGGFLTIGRNGLGFASIINGGSLTLNAQGFGTADSFDTPGINIGRNCGSICDEYQSKGTLVVDNASTITINGWDNATTLGEYGIIGVGRSGIGRMDIRGGSVVTNDPRGITVIGQRIPGAAQSGAGAVNVEGVDSALNAGAVLNIGDRTGGGGDGYLSVRDGGTVTADAINVHDGGFLTGGDGLLVTDTLTVFSGGVFSPGNSPGTLKIDGDLVLNGGTLFLEAYSETEIDKIVVTGDAIFAAGSIQALLGFDPTDLLDFFDIEGTTTILDDFGGVGVTAIPGSDARVGSLVALDLTGDNNDSLIVVPARVQSTVPLSPTILLLIGGLLVLARHMNLNSCSRRAT